jgi:hypothetical protein
MLFPINATKAFAGAGITFELSFEIIDWALLLLIHVVASKPPSNVTPFNI